MNELIAAMALAFIVTFVITPQSIRYLRAVKLVTTDVHKKGKPLVPYPAGISIASGIISGLLLFIFSSVFLSGTSTYLVSIFAGMTSILIITFTGVMDDLNSTQQREGGYTTGKRGLRQWQKPLLTIPAAFPLMAVMAGDTQMVLPLLGSVNFGIFYPLAIIPALVVIASNMVNMLGGFNFMHIGLGIIVTGALGLFALTQGSIVGAVIFLTGAAALVGAAKFNFPPAKILSGDSDSYIIGAIIAVGTILGNIERAAIIVSLPFIIQAALKFYSLARLKHFASDTGILQADGSIKSRYGKEIYSWTHILMKIGKMNEKKIVLTMMLIQLFFASLIFII